MNICIIVDDYVPHSTKVAAKMMHELSIKLVELGHKVVVITPTSDAQERLKTSNIDGVEIWRFKSGRIKNINYFRRFFNEFFLSRKGINAVKGKLTDCSFDGVIYYSPSIFLYGLANYIKNKFKCKSYLVLRDIFPQWAVDANIIKKHGLPHKFLQYFEKKNYKSANMIGVMSEGNISHLNKNFNHSLPIEVLRNWGSIRDYSNLSTLKDFKSENNLTGKIIFFYGGNIGPAQDLPALIKALKPLDSLASVHFILLGEGDDFNKVKILLKDLDLKNFSLMHSVSQLEFDEILKCVDVGLFSLSSKHNTQNFPGKLLGYMQHKIPILGLVNKDNDLKQIIENANAGYIFHHNQDKKLVQQAKELATSKDLRISKGNGAHSLLKSEFSTLAACKKIISHLK